MIKNLADQDAELKRALAQTNAALGKTDTALSGTQGNLASIFQQLPVLVHRTDLLMGDLATTSNSAVTALPIQSAAIHETAIVFGGKDANGYATRISVLVGASSTGAGRAAPPCPAGCRRCPASCPPPAGRATPTSGSSFTGAADEGSPDLPIFATYGIAALLVLGFLARQMGVSSSSSPSTTSGPSSPPARSW